MSKNIWRGVKRNQIDCLWVDSQVMPQDKGTDCTVVMDSAHFPVREAKARIKCDDHLHVIGQRMSNCLFDVLRRGKLSPGDIDRLRELRESWDRVDRKPIAKYLAAVERMKKKAKVKHGS